MCFTSISALPAVLWGGHPHYVATETEVQGPRASRQKGWVLFKMRSVRIQSLNKTLCSGNGENILCDSTTQHWLALELESVEFVRWVQRCPGHLGTLRSLKNQLLEPSLCTHLPACWKCSFTEPHNSSAVLLFPLSLTPHPCNPPSWSLSTVSCPPLSPPYVLWPFSYYCLLWSGALSPPGAPLSPVPEALSAILYPSSLPPLPQGPSAVYTVFLCTYPLTMFP